MTLLSSSGLPSDQEGQEVRAGLEAFTGMDDANIKPVFLQISNHFCFSTNGLSD
jgi:hypothetical protein